MRISLMTPEYPPRPGVGGIATHIHTMARALARAGHEVQVVTPGEPGVAGAPSVVVEDDVTVARVAVGTRFHPLAEQFLSYRHLAHAALSWRPDVVQCPEWQANAWWLTRFADVPVVTRLDTPTGMVMDINGRRWGPRTYLFDFFERDQTRRSAIVYAPSAAIAREVGSRWSISPERIEVIPNALDLSAVREAGAASPKRPLPARFLIYFGRLEARKGIGPFGEALPAVLAAHPDLHAVLVGGEDPASAAEIARFRQNVSSVADRVHLFGGMPRNDALAIVARAELAVVPSLWENFAFVVVESLALGVPVIATNCGGNPEIVEHGRSGWLVPPGDAVALRDELIARLADRAGLEIARTCARERAGRFDTDQVALRVAELLARASQADQRRLRMQVKAT